MNLDWQSLIALAVVLLAAAWLLRRLLRPSALAVRVAAAVVGRPDQTRSELLLPQDSLVPTLPHL